MRRFITLIMICFGVLGTMRAQDEAANVDTRPMWGIKAAFDFNIPGNWHNDGSSIKMFDHGYGATFGAVCNIYLGHGFYFEPGLSFFYDSYAYNDLIIPNEDTVVESPSIFKAGLRVPLVAGYAFDITENLSMVVFTGPELSYAFAGKIRLPNDGNWDDFDDSLFGRNGQRRVDLAWKFGFGVPFSDSWLLSLDASIGVTDLLPGPTSFRDNRVCLSVTRYF